MRRTVAALLFLSLSTFAAGACGTSSLMSRWDQDDEANLGEQFMRCERHEDDDGVFAIDCGLYIYMGWTTERGHEAEVDRRVKQSLSEPFTGVLKELKHLDPTDVDGVKMDLSTATYVPEPDTIVQPSVEVYASQVVEGERQMFRCWHSLAMVTSSEDVMKRVAVCFQGVGALARASR
ncbi:MAG: hypothetical protein EP329_07890 [Deltaproteobacteria bacterium]|nr:MAG: hypothetical protein EP329_07890 [Deltaproteobacteria bacterium]